MHERMNLQPLNEDSKNWLIHTELTLKLIASDKISNAQAHEAIAEYLWKTKKLDIFKIH